MTFFILVWIFEGKGIRGDGDEAMAHSIESSYRLEADEK
jgi:hypothetical protein